MCLLLIEDNFANCYCFHLTRYLLFRLYFHIRPSALEPFHKFNYSYCHGEQEAVFLSF